MRDAEPVRAARTEPYLSTYLNRKGIELGLPVGANFELTARCNFNCKMCYVHLPEEEQKRRGQELSAETWLKIAADARDMGTVFLLLTGGEPFIREDFPYIYTELIKMGFLISINTNASLYSEELRSLFMKYPPSRINVTLYGGSEETYKSLCGNASYGKVISALRSMKEDGLPVRLNVSLTPYNAGDIERVDAISRELGLQAKAAAYMYPPVRVDGCVGGNVARFTPREAGYTMARWYQLRDTKEMFLARAEKLRAMENAGVADNCVDEAEQNGGGEGVMCRAGRSSFWLTWDGRMLPCGTMDIAASYPLRDGFAAAWNEVRERTAAIRMPRECTGCKLRMNCGMCASICAGETGCFDKKPEYICNMAKSMARRVVCLAGEGEDIQ